MKTTNSVHDMVAAEATFTTTVMRAATLFASRDDSRCSNLCVIHVDGDRVVTTDGERMMVIEIPDAPFGEPVSIRLTPALRRIFTRKARLASRTIRIVLRADEIVVHTTEDGSFHVDRDAEMRFPDWRQVIPKEAPAHTGPVGINPAYLAELAQCCDGGVLVTMGSDALSPIRITGNLPTGHNFLYVLMPMRL